MWPPKPPFFTVCEVSRVIKNCSCWKSRREKGRSQGTQGEGVGSGLLQVAVFYLSTQSNISPSPQLHG